MHHQPASTLLALPAPPSSTETRHVCNIAWKNEFEIFRNEIFLELKTKENDILNLQKDLQFASDTLDDYKVEFKKLNEAYKLSLQTSNSLSFELAEVKAELAKQKGEVVYLNDYTRRNSLRFKGFRDQRNENWQQCQAKVTAALREILGVSPEIERAHRLGPWKDGHQREIIVKFLRFPDKEMILCNKQRLHQRNIQIREDFCPDTMALRASLFPRIKAEREKNNIAYVRYRRLVCHPPGGRRRSNSQRHPSNALRGPQNGPRAGSPATRSAPWGVPPAASAPVPAGGTIPKVRPTVTASAPVTSGATSVVPPAVPPAVPASPTPESGPQTRSGSKRHATSPPQTSPSNETNGKPWRNNKNRKYNRNK